MPTTPNIAMIKLIKPSKPKYLNSSLRYLKPEKKEKKLK